MRCRKSLEINPNWVFGLFAAVCQFTNYLLHSKLFDDLFN